jgi:hypothetical protein
MLALGMRQLTSMMVLVVAVVGCGDKWDTAVAKMETFKTRMCACKDKACVDGVKKAERAWEESVTDSFKQDPEPPMKFITKAEAIDNESHACGKAIEEAAGEEAAAASLKKLTDYKDQMCACKDNACATKITDDMTAWNVAQAKSTEVAPSMDQATTKTFTEVSEAMGTSMQTAMTGSAAPAPAPASP